MEVKAQLMQKLDFGAALVRGSGDARQLGLTPAEQKIFDEIVSTKKLKSSRLFNVINGLDRSKLAPEYDYVDGDDFIHGHYEQWSTTFLCATTERDAMLKVDIRDPGTAIKSAMSVESDPLTFLGRFADGDKTKIGDPNLSINRRLQVRNYTVSSALCPNGTDANGNHDGVFYTDRYGKEVFSEPAPDRLRQFIKPGFSVTFEGDFSLSDDHSTGLFEVATEGKFTDFSFALDPATN
jgi:hypothetical protein